MKCEMLALLVIGGRSLWRWLRLLGASNEGALWGTFLFVTGGAVVTRFMVGHVTLDFYFLTPLFFYLSYLLDEKPTARRWLVYLFLFWYAGFYKPNFLIYFVPPLMMEHFLRALLTRRPKILGRGLVGVAFSLASTMVMWLPAWKYFSDYPRADAVPFNATPFFALFANLIMPLKGIPQAFYGGESFMPRHEYNLFIGPVGFALALLGGYRIYRSGFRKRPELLALLVFIVLSSWMGSGFPGASVHSDFQAKLFKLWPGFSSIRIPVRFWFSVYVGFIVFSSLGWWTPENPKYRRAWLICGIAPLIIVALVNLSKTTVLASQSQWKGERIYRDPVVWKIADENGSYQDIREGYGALHCVYNLEVFRAPDLTETDALDVHSTLPLTFQGKWHRWNEIELEARATGPVTFSLNLNHAPYWKFIGEGAQITSKLGSRLTLNAPAGQAKGRLIYEQPLERFSGLVTLGSLLGLLLLALGLKFTGKLKNE